MNIKLVFIFPIKEKIDVSSEYEIIRQILRLSDRLEKGKFPI